MNSPTLLLVDRTHVDRDSVRGDLFPRHWTGLARFEPSQDVEASSGSVNLGVTDPLWHFRIPERLLKESK